MKEGFEAPLFAVDAVVFGAEPERLLVLLVERAIPPFLGSWALPGGFVLRDETLEAAVERELSEEAGVGLHFLEQLYTFGDPGRDPRGRVISTAYWGLVRPEAYVPRAASDASGAAWFPVDGLPALAFDHARILSVALQRLQAKVRYQPVGFELLPEAFPLSRLQRLYEIILGRPLDKRNFRRKLQAMNFLVETGAVEQGVAHRAARLYRFDRTRYDALCERGFLFDL